MASKPNKVVEIQEGFSIGAACHKGFVATFNWLLSCVRNFTGNGVEVTGMEDGRPVVRLKIVAGKNISISESNGVYTISYSGGDE